MKSPLSKQLMYRTMKPYTQTRKLKRASSRAHTDNVILPKQPHTEGMEGQAGSELYTGGIEGQARSCSELYTEGIEGRGGATRSSSELYTEGIERRGGATRSSSELYLHKGNVSQYRKGSYPHIRTIVWAVGPLDVSVLISFINLTGLIICDGLGITTLQGIEVLQNLEVVHCMGNQLTDLIPLGFLPKLHTVLCDRNQIKTTKGLERCYMLDTLHISHNLLPNLNGLEYTKLRIFNCSHNSLTTLLDIDGCFRLQYFDCSYNQISSLEYAIYLDQLVNFIYDDNPVPGLTIRMRRFMVNVAQRKLMIAGKGKGKPIESPRTPCPLVLALKPYVDFLCKLLEQQVPLVTANMISSSDHLSDEAKRVLIAWNMDATVHPKHLVMFGEISCYLWYRFLCRNPNQRKLNELEEFLKGIANSGSEERIEHLLTYLISFGDREVYYTPTQDLAPTPLSNHPAFNVRSSKSEPLRTRRGDALKCDPPPRRRFSLKSILPKSKN